MRMHALAENPGPAAKLKSIPSPGAFLLLLLVVLGSELRADDKAPAPDAPTTELVPPATAEGSKVAGSGSKRKGEITIKNTAKRGIARLELTQLFLGPDGKVVRSAPNEITFHLGALGPGESATVDADASFLGEEDGSESVVGVIQIIEFDDGSPWPPLPAEAPDVDGDAPVGLAMIGVIGKPPFTLPVVHCHNHGDKGVERVMYSIEFFDGDGRSLRSSNISANVSGEKGGLKSMAGTVLGPSLTVPEGTKSAKLHCTSVIFTDETIWQAPEFR